MTTKSDLHHIIDGLPEPAVEEIAEILERWRNDYDAGVPRVFRDAPWDDQPSDPEEEEGVREALEDIREGRVLSHEEVRRLLLDGE